MYSFLPLSQKNTLSDTVLEARTGKSVTKTHCPFPGGTEDTSEDYFEIAELMWQVSKGEVEKMLGEHSAGRLITVSDFLVSAWKPAIMYLSLQEKRRDPFQDTGGFVFKKLYFVFSKDILPHSLYYMLYSCRLPTALPKDCPLNT